MHRFLLLLCLGSLMACQGKREPGPLPILGNREVVNGDTIYHEVRDFSFIDQDSLPVTQETFAGRAYVSGPVARQVMRHMFEI